MATNEMARYIGYPGLCKILEVIVDNDDVSKIDEITDDRKMHLDYLDPLDSAE
jgi:hypothetical protein